jgi:hypothetical protein
MRNQLRKFLLLGWKGSPKNYPDANPLLHLPKEEKLWESWRKAFELADHKASDYGNKFRNTYTYLYFFSIVAIGFAVLNIGLHLESPLEMIFPIGELVSLVTIAWFYWSGKKNKWHEKWVQYRFHSEYLRCLPLICLKSPENLDYKSYGSLYADEKKKLHEEMFLLNPSISSCMNYAIALAKNQLKYFDLASAKEKFIRERVETISYILFGVTFIAVILHFFIHTGWIVVITTLLPAATASLHGVMGSEESGRNEVRYKVMEEGITSWLSDYEGCTDDVVKSEGMHELANLLLSEADGWHKLMKDLEIHLG